FFQAEDGIRDFHVTGVQTCALPIFLGLPIPVIRQLGPSASCALLAEGHGVPVFGNLSAALAVPDTALRLFGKPRVAGHRRVAVTLARGRDTDEARAIAREAAAAITLELA